MRVVKQLRADIWCVHGWGVHHQMDKERGLEQGVVTNFCGEGVKEFSWTPNFSVENKSKVDQMVWEGPFQPKPFCASLAENRLCLEHSWQREGQWDGKYRVTSGRVSGKLLQNLGFCTERQQLRKASSLRFPHKGGDCSSPFLCTSVAQDPRWLWNCCSWQGLSNLHSDFGISDREGKLLTPNTTPCCTHMEKNRFCGAPKASLPSHRNIKAGKNL